MSTTPTTTRRRRIVLLGLLAASVLAATFALRVSPPRDGDGSAIASTSERPPVQPSPAGHPVAPSRTAPTTVTTDDVSAVDDVAVADNEVNDDDEFPDVPDAGDDGPGPWYPPFSGADDFAAQPVVLDLVSEVDPQVSEEAEGTIDDNFASDAGCAAQCIRRAWATMGGTGAELRVQTNTPARIWVVLDSPAVEDSGYQLRQDWTVSFDDLAPDTTYNVTLAAEDANGNVSHRYAQIHTLERTVVVTFTSIDVINDADHGSSKGEIEFFFAVNGTWRPDAHQGTQKIKSGHSIHLGDRGEVVLLEDASADLVLIVQGVEHDHSSDFCSGGAPPFDSFGGDHGPCVDEATAFEVFNVDDLGVAEPALPSAHDGYFQLVTEDNYLKFRIHGTIDVTYG